MTSPPETYLYDFSEREGRHAVRTVIDQLGELALPPAPGIVLPTVETVLGVEPFPPGSMDRKFNRYAFCAGALLNNFLPQVVAGDGPKAAHFTDFVEAEMPPDSTPYYRFRRSVEHTFDAGWTRYTDSQKEGARWAIDTYHQMLADDPTTSACGSPIDEAIIQGGVDAPFELAYYGLMIGVPAGKHPLLSDGSPTALLQAARDCSHRLIRKGRLPLRFVFWDKLSYPDVKYGELELTQAASGGRWHLDTDNGLFAPYNPNGGDVPAIGPTVRCPADLIRLRPADRYTALENVIFAGINALHAHGLFNPDIAGETWQRHQQATSTVPAFASLAAKQQALLEGREEFAREVVRYRALPLEEII